MCLSLSLSGNLKRILTVIFFSLTASFSFACFSGEPDSIIAYTQENPEHTPKIEKGNINRVAESNSLKARKRKTKSIKLNGNKWTKY